MPSSAKNASSVSLSPRFRVFYRDEIALGPGKVDLLKAIKETGSIRQGASNLDMSYMRAWKLIKTMNASFNEPLIEALRGGKKHGGATLTPTGRTVLRIYERMERKALTAIQQDWIELRSLLRL
jgi:molybdate transport system regulatory protein